MGAAAAAAQHFRRPLGRPELWKFGQDVNYISHFSANSSLVAARTAQFDGFAFQTPTCHPIHNNDAITLGEAQTAFSGLAAALPNWGGMQCAPMMYWFETEGFWGNWTSDADWARIAQNMANYVQAAFGAGCTLLLFDNEAYPGSGTSWDGNNYGADNWNTHPFPLDWVSGGGILPGHTLAQAQTLVRARGEQCMDAIRAQTPHARIVILHPMGIGSPNFTTYISPTPFADVHTFHELNGVFQSGFHYSASKPGSSAVVWDGNEVYDTRGVAEFNRLYQWTKSAGRDIDTNTAPRATVAPFRASCAFTLWDYDDRNEDGPQTGAELKQNITDAMRVSEGLTILYTESHVTGDWWQQIGGGTGPTGGGGDGKVTQPYLDAVAEAKIAGRGGNPVGFH